MTETEKTYSIIQEINFIYTNAVEYDYDTVKAYNHDTRCADDYCRCSTIEDCTIKKVNILEFIRLIKEHLDIDTENDSFNYDITNVCKYLTTDDFVFNICGGYYGQELNSIKLSDYIVSKLNVVFSIKAYRREKLKNIDVNIKKDNYILDEYIKRILTEEYGYVLDSLKNSKFKIIEVSINDIIFTQKDYNKFVKSGDLSKYRNKKGVCGLVKMINDKYIIIDGYHRINANIDKERIKVILAY